MSQTSRLQCLFCRCQNPPDADYCVNCDEQLNLQPCMRCGAVDLRIATKCYKCGESFPPADGADISNRFTPVAAGQPPVDANPASSTDSNIGRNQLDHPPFESNQPTSTAAKNPAFDIQPTKTRARRATSVPIVAIGIILILGAAAVYLLRASWPTPLPGPAQHPPAHDVSGALNATPVNGNHALRSGPGPHVDPHSADAKRPMPAAGDNATTGQEVSGVAACPSAVAALGLCTTDGPQEKR
jgi:ribosomal protein L40E